MKNLFKEKLITGSVEVFPNIKREDSISVLESVFDVVLEERESDEYMLYEAEKGGVSYTLALNYDWYLDERDKQSIEVHITSHWDDRANTPNSDISPMLSDIPDNSPQNGYGHIVISKLVADLIARSTGYRCETDEEET